MFTGFRLKVRNFFKKYAKVIIFLLIIWLIIIFVNTFLSNNTFKDFERTTYNEHEAILDSSTKVPEKLRQPINETVDTYFNYCNNKQYEEAYSMISDDCKKVYFPTIDRFKEYVDLVFNEKKIYYLQNYSNYKDIWVEQCNVFYEQENYKIKIKNKTSNTVVLADTQEKNEVLLQVGTENREANNDNLNIVIYPDETKEYTLKFTKFFDDESKTKGLLFNAVRILPKYSGFAELKEYELSTAEKLYSITIPF